jgi:hypothetical protein
MPYNVVHKVFPRHHTQDRYYDDDDVAGALPDAPKLFFAVFGLSCFTALVAHCFSTAR